MYKQALDITKKAGERLKSKAPSIITSKTGIQDLVTEMDKNTELFLRNELIKLTPGCSFIGEEGNKEPSDSMWIIDPIDGTTNFINAHDNYAITLAYFKDKKPVLGITYDVDQDTMYWAIANQGAYINENRFIPTKPAPKLEECLWEASLHTIHKHPKLMDLYKKTRGHRNLGSCALSMIRVALGKADFYISDQVKCWDYAGSHIFIQETKNYYWQKEDFFSTKPNLCIYARNKELIPTIQDYL